MSMGSGGVFGNIPYGGGVPDGVWQQKLGLPAILGGGQTPPLPAVTQPIDQGKMKTWQKIVGAIGDGLQVAGGGKASFMPAILDMQARTDEERKWQAQLANQLQIERERTTATTRNKTWQDNAGNMWRMGENGSPEPAPFFVDRAPKVSLTSDGYGGVTYTNQPNPYATSVPPTAPVGELTMIPDQTAAPSKAAPTKPSQVISQAEFLRFQKINGPQKAAAWLRANKIAIGN
jgi:hypothetical protein